MNKFDPIRLLDGHGMYINNCLDNVESLSVIIENKGLEEDFRQDGSSSGWRYILSAKDEEYEIIDSAMAKAADIFLTSTNRSINDYTKMEQDYKIFKWFTPRDTMLQHTDHWYVGDKLISPDITLVMYLTGDFDGGKLVFGELDIKIQPQAGDIAVFDSTTLHGVEPLGSGRRITVQSSLFKK